MINGYYLWLVKDGHFGGRRRKEGRKEREGVQNRYLTSELVDSTFDVLHKSQYLNLSLIDGLKLTVKTVK